jgi:hypothetical protein
MPAEWPASISSAQGKAAANALLVEIEERLEILGKVIRRIE